MSQPFDLNQALVLLLEHTDLSAEQMEQVTREFMSPETDSALMAAILTALRMKGESYGEITGGARAMRSLSKTIKLSSPQVIDIVGTGGDGQSLFNVSTTCSFVVAAAGMTVAKHGNRGVSSRSGSSDFFDAAGIRLDMTPEQLTSAIDAFGVGFLYAPTFHPAMKYAAGVRKSLKVRTLFNLLGPLTNPAGANQILLGVYSTHLLEPMALALRELGIERAMVVHSDDGLDELSIAAKSRYVEVKDGQISSGVIDPADYGLKADLSGLQIENPSESFELISAAFGAKNKSFDQGRLVRARQLITINSGAALYTSGCCQTLEQGMRLAEDLIENGGALEKLRDLQAYSDCLS